MNRRITTIHFSGSLILIASLFIAAFIVSVPAAADDISSFRQYLSTLDKKDPASIAKALDFFKTHFGAAAAADTRDEAFMEFRAFYYGVISQYNPIIFSDAKLQERLLSDKTRKELESMKKQLSQYGLTLTMSEGTYYVSEEPGFLLKTFSSLVTPSAREYLKLRQKEIKEGFSEDAELLIPWKALADRIATWEKFLSTYPKAALAKQGLLHYNDYLATFLTGIDNSPVFNEKGALNPEVRQAYEYYVQKYPSTKSGQLVKQYYEILKKHGFKTSSESQKFLKDHNIRNMIGVEPPAE